MSQKTSLITFIIVAIVLIGSITLWANGRPTKTVAPREISSSSTMSTSTASYTLEQVASHKTSADCWTAVSGKVYNLTPFTSKHPGGVDNIVKVCGIDGTAIFTAQHMTQQGPNDALAGLQIGVLVK